MPFLSFLHLPRLGELLTIRRFRPAWQSFWRPRRGKQVERARLALEQLESRYTPSTIALTSSPQQIPLGSVEPGFTVKIKVNISIGQADPNELSEGEGFIKVSLQGPGVSQTIDTYGITTVPINITQKDEQLTASLILPPNNDGDEGSATVEVLPTAKVQIAGPDKSDNIALYNAANNAFASFFGFGSPLEYTQTIPVTIINQSDTMATFAVSVDPSSGGSGTLDQSSVTIAGNGQTTLTFTPNKDSVTADDVHIVAKYDNAKVGQDDMTVVSVLYSANIYNTDTPQAMIDQKAYRIPPRVNTAVHVIVTPNLTTSKQNESVSLTVTNQNNDANGIATVNGSSDPQKIYQDGDIQLSGTKQTAPGSSGFTGFSGQAGNLRLVVQVRSQTTAQSNGFSVAAIPTDVSFTDQGVITQETQDGTSYPYRGFLAHYNLKSDSGNFGDLSQIEISEQVQPITSLCTGVFKDNNSVSTSTYMSANDMVDVGTLDHHAIPVQNIYPKPHTGTLVFAQTFEFKDARTGVKDIPVPNSGFRITHTVTPNPAPSGRVFNVTVTKVGSEETANGIHSLAGTGNATEQQTAVIPVDIPLVVDRQLLAINRFEFGPVANGLTDAETENPFHNRQPTPKGLLKLPAVLLLSGHGM